MSCADFNDSGDQICCHCGKILDEGDDLAIDSGYCSEECHINGAFDEEDDE